MSSPLNTMRPASGRRILVIRRSSVVLPAPLGPMSPTISSRLQLEAYLVDRGEPAEALGETFDREESVAHLLQEYSVDEKFLQRMDSELAGWRDPAARLHDALKKNEFELYCQPILPLNGSRDFPVGEVLVRMREEERALLPPGEFLPVFEHYGMMPQLDRWVVFHAVKRLSRGSRIPRLSVNVSAQTLQDPGFLPYVDAAMQKFGVERSALLFEIDESDALLRPGRPSSSRWVTGRSAARQLACLIRGANC